MAKRKRKNIRKTYKSKYSTGGSPSMYNDNTIQAAGQGNNTTANIVFQESNPEVLQNKLDFLTSKKKELLSESKNKAAEIAQQKEADKIKLLQDQQASDAKSQQVTGMVKGVTDQFNKATLQQQYQLDEQGEPLLDKAGDKIPILKGTDVDKSLIKRGSQIYGEGFEVPRGVKSIINPTTGAEASVLPGDPVPPGWEVTGVSGGDKLGTTVMKLGAGYKDLVAKGAATTMGKAGSWMTTGLTGGTSMAAQMLNPAMIASVGGMAIKHWSDDDDPTTFTGGEATGSVLSGAGTGAGIGGMVAGPFGAAAGAIIGGAWAGIKGLRDRNKARREKRRLRDKRREKVAEYNKDVKEQLGSAVAQARAAEIEAKTYSGYDLGRNVTARYGGMRMGTPRYGFSV